MRLQQWIDGDPRGDDPGEASINVHAPATVEEAALVLAQFARTAPGRLPDRVMHSLNVVDQRLGRLLP